MSTLSGDAAFAAGAVAGAKALLTEAQAEEARQEDLFQPTPEEMLLAREEIGADAGRLSLVRQAREIRKRGRPPGAKNKRSDDFAKFILSHGQHPAVTMMQIQASAPEVLIEASLRKRVFTVNKDGKAVVIDEAMTYEAAQALRIRCAEALLPYLESKKPVAIDMSFAGVADMMIEGVTHTREEMDETRRLREAIDGEFFPVDDDAEPDA